MDKCKYFQPTATTRPHPHALSNREGCPIQEPSAPLRLLLTRTCGVKQSSELIVISLRPGKEARTIVALKQIMLSRIPMFGTTVAQKLNQGTPENGRSPCPTASFRRGFRVIFWSFFVDTKKDE